ncbi:pyridoxamine 5'-phosphate oxidase family protein [Streptomyces mutabilis]|uniref:pyridoxamine 5'-phosphate oxidase family protein n=1 Tax=Streptomyces mutabilis TaxID=67332 RepID=UPI0019ACF022|nr:pyridoxamine 5'-phosphate oxidase [Streptomyces mutabilis]
MTDSQRRGRKIMMTPGELDAFLTTQRTCRVATASADGTPLVSTLWFARDGSSMWLYSVVRSRALGGPAPRPRVAIVVDPGEEYDELRGAELSGRVQFVGGAPGRGELCTELDFPKTLFARKNFRLEEVSHDGRHACCG